MGRLAAFTGSRPVKARIVRYRGFLVPIAYSIALGVLAILGRQKTFNARGASNIAAGSRHQFVRKFAA